ncbi:AAA family ATPase [Mycobacterium sp. AMU20-3851]|uniref:ATP-binding protein n=1 Tax=Mycobacterium sp. AMU20-3851 TaxID=3122055 RepID=UPI0037543388
MALVGRHAECVALDFLIRTIRDGGSAALVLSGDAGIGKTALLDELAQQAVGCRVIRIAGIESEMDLAFAALHQLCTPLWGRSGRLPVPQQRAVRRAFGADTGSPPDRFLVGLAVLSLLADAAEDQPLLVLVDDQQWLDGASAQILAFVARRLGAESVAIVFGTRSPGLDLTGLPQLHIDGLSDDESGALLSTALSGPVDPRVRDRLIAEARGNPLALLELPRSLTRQELAGGYGPPGAPVSHSLEATFRRQIDTLPEPTRRMLALAAADPAGDPALLWRAVDELALDPEAVTPAMEAGLISIDGRVRFRHPLIRSTAYRGVPLSDRQALHGALAAATDPDADPDRRAWHLGHAAVAPDDDVADELHRCAERAQSRGGVTAAAAFLERSAELTRASSRRCDRAIAAATAKAQSGMLDAARDLLKMAAGSPMTELQMARTDLVRAQMAFISNHGRDAAPLLLGAAQRLESIDPTLARETYLDALSAAIFAGRLAGAAGAAEVAKAASATASDTGSLGPADALLDGLAIQYDGDFSRGLPLLRHALGSYGEGMSLDQELRWMLLACIAATRIWDIDRHRSLGVRYVQLAHDTGAVSQLPLALSGAFLPLLLDGDFDEAGRVAGEMSAAIDAMGKTLTPYSAIVLAAWRGRPDELAALGDDARADAQTRGEGHGLTVIAWAEAVLANGSADYKAARDAAAYASACRGDGGASWWALPELVEAAARLGDTSTAGAALNRLIEMTTPSDTDWSLGVESRARALLADDATAEDLYRRAIEHFRTAGLRPDLGRTHLLYGEWLRRQRRRVHARAELRAAHELFGSIGMEMFADRARRELAATGEKARRRAIPETASDLTAQETQIARLAREGLSNPEIGARLFISARTVQYHLAKVFAKLGIRSRGELAAALTDVG